MRIPFFEDADPSLAWRRKVRLDAVLFVLFWIVMCDRATGNPVHETLGVALGTLALGHALLNRRWYVRRMQSLVGRSPRRGKSTVRDRVLLLTNGLLTVLFSASFASGLVCSQTILGTLTPEAWRMDLVYREVHVALSLWCFLAAALHAGLHGSIAAARWMPLWTRWTARVGTQFLQGAALLLLLILCVWTYRAGAARDVLYVLQAESAFLFVEPGEGLWRLPVDLAASFLALAAVVYTLDRVLSPRS